MIGQWSNPVAIRSVISSGQHDGGVSPVGVQDIAGEEGRLVGQAATAGLSGCLGDEVLSQLDPEGGGASLCSGQDQATVPGAQIHDPVPGCDLGQLQHGLEDGLRGGHVGWIGLGVEGGSGHGDGSEERREPGGRHKGATRPHRPATGRSGPHGKAGAAQPRSRWM